MKFLTNINWKNWKTEKNHYYFCPKIVAAKWGLPPKNVANPEKRLSMHGLVQGMRINILLKMRIWRLRVEENWGLKGGTELFLIWYFRRILRSNVWYQTISVRCLRTELGGTVRYFKVCYTALKFFFNVRPGQPSTLKGWSRGLHCHNSEWAKKCAVNPIASWLIQYSTLKFLMYYEASHSGAIQ